MSQSIKRDGWYFRSFGYIKRELSLLTLYYLPSSRILGPGNTEQLKTLQPLTPAPGLRDSLWAEAPGQPTPQHMGTANLVYVALI